MSKATLTIDLPKDCCSCRMMQYKYCYAVDGTGEIEDQFSRPKWCPLVPVIEPTKVHYTLTGPSMGKAEQ